MGRRDGGRRAWRCTAGEKVNSRRKNQRKSQSHRQNQSRSNCKDGGGWRARGRKERRRRSVAAPPWTPPRRGLFPRWFWNGHGDGAHWAGTLSLGTCGESQCRECAEAARLRTLPRRRRWRGSGPGLPSRRHRPRPCSPGPVLPARGLRTAHPGGPSLRCPAPGPRYLQAGRRRAPESHGEPQAVAIGRVPGSARVPGCCCCSFLGLRTGTLGPGSGPSTRGWSAPGNVMAQGRPQSEA